MKSIVALAKPLSWASLLLIVVPPILQFNGAIGSSLMNQLLLVGTFAWFVFASLWMKPE